MDQDQFWHKVPPTKLIIAKGSYKVFGKAVAY